ncbi:MULTISPECIES: helix-turn-helix domain-containing protein [unclassified Streptomyces]|uniref:winged helix-turn-helix transcriptional regulator n=1 Tax=unclassified Streptomyces TaxID=2593676 RepID=UPI000DB9256C|nr:MULTISPECIES: helix-turn-helix domain-containing protein [unclassified Streptomyces]MYT69757.1 transcriptional regulator [Streptomyces sp. SID8367]RAJ69376.1 HxlR family transcriptional regulator [Streptomyces sp. PsTaAH-137]
MATREYGQFCGLARAMEMVGERWSMLIVRDLLNGPRRYTDLRRGLPAIPTNILSNRLKQLEEAGLATRRALPHPERAVVYELTDYGRDLEPALIALGRWGARTLTEPRPGEAITAESVAMSFRTSYRPEAAYGTTAIFEVRMGDFTINLQVTGGALAVAIGPHPAPDLVIERLHGHPVRELMSGSKTPADVLAEGSVHIKGDPALLDRFVRLFHF